MRTGTQSKWALLLVLLMISLIAACSSGSGSVRTDTTGGSSDTEYYKKIAEDTKLDTAYKNIIFSKFETTQEIEKTYPGTISYCRNSALTRLKEKNIFSTVTIEEPDATYEGPTLLVKVKVTHLRIVSGVARAWGGIFAGSSGMETTLTLIDTATNATVRVKEVGSYNNPYGAMYSGSDHSLPIDMGKILADYLVTVIPAIPAE